MENDATEIWKATLFTIRGLATHDEARIGIFIPYPVPDTFLKAILTEPEVGQVVAIGTRADMLHADGFNRITHCKSWFEALQRVGRPFVVVGIPNSVSFGLLVTAIFRGYLSVTTVFGLEARTNTCLNRLTTLIADRLLEAVSRRSKDDILVWLYDAFRSNRTIFSIWKKLVRGKRLSERPQPDDKPVRKDLTNSGFSNGQDGLFRSILETCRSPREQAKIGSIVLANDTLGPGGAERQVVNTIAGLIQCKSVRPILLCQYLDKGEENRFFLPSLVNMGGIARQLPRTRRLSVHGLNAFPEYSRFYLQQLNPYLLQSVLDYVVEFNRISPNVAHAWQDDTNIKVGLAAALCGVPRIVLSCRTMSPAHYPYAKSYIRPGYQALAALPQVRFLCNSRAGAEEYSKWAGVPAGRFSVVHNAFVDNALEDDTQLGVAARAQMQIPQKFLLVGSILRFSEEKQPFVWLDLAEKLLNRNLSVKFLLVGDGPEFSRFRIEVTRRGFENDFLLVGLQENVSPFLAAMDVFVLTSRVEGMPNAVLEAQAAGKPICAFDVGGIGETVSPENRSRLVRPDDLAGLTRNIAELLQSPEQRASLGHASSEYVRTEFGLAKMINKTWSLYGFEAGSGP